MKTIEMALPMEGGLMMDEDAASIVAQIKTLLKQLRTKGATDKEIDSLLSYQQPGRAYVNTQGKLVLPDEGEVQIKLTPMERTLYILFLRYPVSVLPPSMKISTSPRAIPSLKFSFSGVSS
jgi:hypothetical protein